jgi:hypothetical protein
VCKQVQKEKGSGEKNKVKTDNQKTRVKRENQMQPLTSHHYLHFSYTIINFFLLLMGRGMGWRCFECLKLLIMKHGADGVWNRDLVCEKHSARVALMNSNGFSWPLDRCFKLDT